MVVLYVSSNRVWGHDRVPAYHSEGMKDSAQIAYCRICNTKAMYVLTPRRDRQVGGHLLDPKRHGDWVLLEDGTYGQRKSKSKVKRGYAPHTCDRKKANKYWEGFYR